MKHITLLQFNELSDLATFIKKFQPAAYVINTLQVTLLTSLSTFEIALAIEAYNAQVMQQKVDVPVQEKAGTGPLLERS